MLDNFPDGFRRSDEEVLNEFRQKQINFDLEERKNDVNNSRSLFIGALAGLAMAGIVGWLVLGPRYQSTGPEDVPLITRQRSAVKIQPTDRGDIELASKERTIYGIIEKRAAEDEKEEVMSSAETPDIKGIDKLVEETVAEASDVTDGASVESLTAKPKAENLPEKKSVETVAEDVKSSVKNEVESKSKSVPVAAPAVEVKKEPVVAKTGNWQIQLMSSPNKAAVDKSWSTMSQKYPMLKELAHETESADLGAKGTFYRLKAGSFATKEAATEFCTKLKAVGGSCFTVKK